ncbi:TetR/AcrR family transcriptional regulator [Mycolicibacterium sp. 120270]|uniref:TetR/AcrR family transcriptional regulator n=1 Tax=Mycolicibacterium sp. 120270 TaxID=3090600 RepID=UPI00299E689D|nr:TetR/AcrR family transcriptional regulator [Mycolicibacterium sp. 120270]MDX1884905.1 TetR/AcrR family transcriptional regulator [Mycolicibacterium sp. 120270]
MARKYAPRLPREQRREQLLDAAMTVLADCQLHELSMEAVAEAAGVGKPVLYTVFRTRGELVAALLRREHGRGIEQVRAAMPDDLTVLGPTGAYAATVSAFLHVVLENPTRWRLILTLPDSAPREYRDALRSARGLILAQAEELAKAGIALTPALAQLDPVLLGHTMLSFAEMLGRLAVSDPETFPRDRLETFARTAMSLAGGGSRDYAK